MNYFSPLHLVVYGFLVITVLVGWYSGRNVKTFSDYATANRSLGSGILTLTLLATFMSANWVERIGYTYLVGPLVAGLKAPLISLSFIFAAYHVSPHIIQFHQCYTMAELFGVLYGKQARRVTALLTLVVAFLMVSAQLAFMGKVVAPLLGMSYTQIIWLIGGCILLYAVLGGMRSVALTDVAQFVALTVMLAWMAYKVVDMFGGMQLMFSKIKANLPQHLSFVNNPLSTERSWWKNCLNASFWGLFGGMFISPPNVQRILLSQNVKGVRRMLLSGAAVVPVLFTLLAIIGLGARLKFAHLARNAVLPSIIGHLFQGAELGLIVAGLLAVLMSTIDSFLHSAAVTLVYDLLYPGKTLKKDNKKHLRLLQGIVTGMGLGALFISIRFSANLYFNYAAFVLLSFLVIPLLAGIMGMKTNAKDFWTCIVMTLTVEVLVLAWSLQHRTTMHVWWYSAQKDIVWFFAILTNAITYFGLHYLRYGGFVRANAAAHTQTSTHWGKSLLQLIPTPQKAQQFARQTIFADQEGDILAFFLCLNYLIPFFMSPTPRGTVPTGLLLGFKSIAVGLSTGLLIKDLWPVNWKQRYFSLYWLITITYCLPFMACYVFMLDGGSMLTVFNLMLAIILLMAIVDWKGFGLMGGLGWLCAWGIYQMIHGAMQWQLDADGVYVMAYGVLFSLLIGGLFVRKTAKHNADKLRRTVVIADSAGHEIKNKGSIMMQMGQLFELYLQNNAAEVVQNGEQWRTINLPEKAYQTLLQSSTALQRGAQQLKNTVNRFNSTLKEQYSTTKVKQSIRTIVQQAIALIQDEEEVDIKAVTIVGKEDFEALLPETLFPHAVSNLVKNAFKHGQDTQVRVTIDSLARTLTVADNGKGIPTKILPHIFTPFYTGNRIKGTGTGLALVVELVHEAEGMLDLVSNTANGDKETAFQMKFPPLV